MISKYSIVGMKNEQREKDERKRTAFEKSQIHRLTPLALPEEIAQHMTTLGINYLNQVSLLNS
jgi:hypothetical protein